MQSNKDWKTLKSEIVFDNKWVSVIRDSVKLPSGVVIKDYLTTKLKSVAMIFAVTKENNVIFVKQYRHGSKKVLLELPAGVYDEGDNLEEVARHELEQEAGYKADNLISLGRIVDYPTKDTHCIDMFLATEVIFTNMAQPEETEDIEVVLVPLENVLSEIQNNNVIVSGTITCILKSLIYLNRININSIIL